MYRDAIYDNNVILGDSSADKQKQQVSSATVGGVTYSGFAGTASGVVSVGSAGAERQLVNVAPGAITSSSTDAINGSQLYAAMSVAQSSIASLSSSIGGGSSSGSAVASLVCISSTSPPSATPRRASCLTGCAEIGEDRRCAARGRCAPPRFKHEISLWRAPGKREQLLN